MNRTERASSRQHLNKRRKREAVRRPQFDAIGRKETARHEITLFCSLITCSRVVGIGITRYFKTEGGTVASRTEPREIEEGAIALSYGGLCSEHNTEELRRRFSEENPLLLHTESRELSS